MPMMRQHLEVLNDKFSSGKIADLAKQPHRFAPGADFDAGLLYEEGTAIHRLGRAFFAKMPRSIHEALNAVIRSALATTPPTNIVFAWAPSYDWEMTVWDAKCGITVLLKSRFADDETGA